MTYSSEYARALLNGIASKVPALGRLLIVCSASDTSLYHYQALQELFEPQDGRVMFFTSLASAYEEAQSNNNDVIVLDANSTHTLTSMLTVAKNRVHFIGMDGGGRHFGQRTKVSLGVTTAATDIGTIKVTGVGCTFRNIKFMNSNTVAEGIYCFVDAGEYTLVENCEIYKETDLDVTGAAELVANGDSSKFKDCTIGSTANALSGDIIRPCVLVTGEVGGTGKKMRDNMFENCIFWRKCGHVNNRFVYGANATDVERMMYFKDCLFFNSLLAAADPAQAVAFGSTQTEGNVILMNCGGSNVTKISTTTGVQVVGPAVNSGAGIAVNAA